MSSGNTNVNQTFDFDHLTRVLFDDGGWIAGDDEWICYADFYGRDVNGMFAHLASDTPETVRIDTGPHEQRLANPKYIRALLGEFGFVVDGSRWYKTLIPMETTTPKEDAGYIYLLRMDGSNYYKIGKSKDTSQRVKQLGILLPKPVTLICETRVSYMSRYEAVIHKDYAIFHTHGEWFELDEKAVGQLVEFMRAIHRG